MFTKRLIFIFGVALSCAILASVLVVKYVHTREEEAARAKIDLQPVVIATSDIPVGAHLDATLVSLRDWPKSGMPQGALVEPEAVQGRIVRGQIARNEPILEDRLFPKDLSAAPGIMSVIVPPGKRAMAVGVNEVIGVSGFILPKDRVDVIATRTNQVQHPSSETILQNIEVLAVGKRYEQEGKQNIEVPTVTLAVTPKEGERLALALNEGKIHIALRSVLDTQVVQVAQVASATRSSTIVRKASGVTAAAIKPQAKNEVVVEVIRGEKRTLETYPLE